MANDQVDGLDAPAFDPDALRERYRQERAKRIHPKGSRQYRRVKDGLSHFVQDPYVERVERDPVFDEVLSASRSAAGVRA